MRYFRNEVGGAVGDFLDGYDPAVRGSADEAVLALALGSGNADRRNAAKKKLKAAKYEPLTQALKALPRRAYGKGHGKKLVSQLEADLDTIASLGIDRSEFALNLVPLLPRFAKPLVAAFIDCATVDAGIIDSWIDRERMELRALLPVDAAVFHECMLAADLEWQSVVLWVTDAQEIGDWSDIRTASFTMEGPITSVGAWPAGVRELELLGTKLAAFPGAASVESLRITAGGGVHGRAPVTDLPLADLPSGTAMPNLRTLFIRGASSLAHLPDDIDAMTHLHELRILACGLRTLPESLGTLSLTDLRLDEIAFEVLPSIAGTPPSKADVSNVTCTGPIPETTKAYLHWPSTMTALRSLAVVEWMAKSIPSVRTELDAAQSGKSQRGSELLLAITRTYIDVEHGAKSNTFWKKQLEEFGGELEAAVSRTLPARITSPEDARARASAVTIEGFNADEFVRLVSMILQSEHHQQHRADWF